MGLDPVLDARLVEIGLEAGNREEAIDCMATILEREGYVKETYRDAVLERERVFPTGLPTGAINIAIPHADAVHVLRSAIAVATLAHPVEFQEMGDPSSILDVDIVMVLAIRDPKEMVPLLGKVCSVFQDQGLLASIKEARDPGKIVDLLRAQL